MSTMFIDKTTIDDAIHEIRKLRKGAGGASVPGTWKPHPDWWDIKTMVDTGVLEWSGETVSNVRYGFIVSDINNTTRLPSGYLYYLSDGSYYSGSSIVTHTWDRTKDKPCSNGYTTRAVIVCKETRDVAISQRSFSSDFSNSIYLYLGNCNVTSLNLCGSTVHSNANRVIQAVLGSETTTAKANAIPDGAFRLCISLRTVMIPQGVDKITDNTFADSSIETIIIPSSITAIGLLNLTYALTNIIVPQNFNLPITLSYTYHPYLSVTSLENIILNYADRTEQEPLVFTVGTTNLAKLSIEIKALAASKNITLA